MRSRAIPAVGLSVAALALTTAFAGTATASSSAPSAVGHGTLTASVSADKTCFASGTTDSGVGIVSQNFEASFDAYDNQGAADFKVKKKCAIKTVSAAGIYFNGSGPARDENVTIYKDKKGKPGKVVTSQTVAGSDSGGSFTIPIKKTKLKKGTYWVSVQANLDFSVGGEWGWETTLDQSGKGDMWKNPGDGFATGCTNYGDMVSCLGAQGQGPDFMVTLS
jgi:hypothetical protein